MTDRPPMTHGQRVALGVIMSFLAFWIVALAFAWSNQPDDAVICNDGQRYRGASQVMGCLDQHSR